MAQAQQQQTPQQLIQRPNIIHPPKNNNQNTMNFTNTTVDAARNHTASYVSPALNIPLNSRSIITPPNLPMHTQRQVNQRAVVQQPQQQSTNNNNINNVSILEQTNSGNGSNNNNNQSNDYTLQTIKPEKFAVACNAKAHEGRIRLRELTNLSDDEKTKICEKLELLKPILDKADEILTYYTKSHIDTQKLLKMKSVIDDQLKALPGKYLLSLKQADDLLTQFSKYLEFVESTKKELNFTTTNSLMPANDQIIPPIANKTISLTAPNKKHKLENEQENQSSDSHENLNKKGRLEIHVTDRNEIKNNNSENVNNYNNGIDLWHDNPPKDYNKEPSFEELYESIRKLDNTMKDNMDTGEATRGGEESYFPCRTYVENSSDLDRISSALSKTA